jgi:hypothetical protein
MKSRGVALVAGAGAVFLLPWIVLLGVTLPGRFEVRNWPLAWVGFDLLMAAGLALVGWLAYRRDPRLVPAACCTATVAVVDAWFDVTTSAGSPELLEAVLMAVGGELPLAVFCLVVAHRADRRRWRSPQTVPGPRRAVENPADRAISWRMWKTQRSVRTRRSAASRRARTAPSTWPPATRAGRWP